MFVTKNCKECSFYETTKEIKSRENSNVGLCRYNPPSIMEPLSPIAKWPIVSDNDWCGKFQN